jgi:hypothetical protein
MPTNFFFQLLLVPTCSSSFLYTTHKTPIPSPCSMTSMLLNCTHGLMSGTMVNCDPHSSPSHMTSMSLNCTIPFSDPLSSTTLNCTVSIPVQWITHSSSSYHSSHIAFVKDTNDTQHMLMCPTLQMYLHDGPCCGPHRWPNGLVACTQTCYITNPLESNSIKHYSCSAPSPCYLSYTSQLTLDGHSPDIPLDTLDGHSSLVGDI